MAGTPSDELKAFRASYDKLLRSIQSPEIIAASLFARNIITMELKSQVVDVLGITPFLKTMKLLDAVYGKITEDPKNLDTFLAVLNEDPALTTVIKTVKGQCSSRKRSRSETPGSDDDSKRQWQTLSVRFDKCKGKVIELLERKPVNPLQLKNFLCKLSHPLKPEKPYITMIRGKRSRFKDANTVTDIIEALVPKFINYMNVGLLEMIVDKFESEESQKVLQEYRDVYSQHDRKLTVSPNSGPASDEELEQLHGAKRLRVKTGLNPEKATQTDVEKVQSGLEAATGIDGSFIVPAQHTEGCLLLIFLVPEDISEIFHELCEEDLEILADCGVTRLEIDNIVIENIEQYQSTVPLYTEDGDVDVAAKGFEVILQQRVSPLSREDCAHVLALISNIPRSKLSQVCSDGFLYQVAQLIENWTRFAPYLGISELRMHELLQRYPSIDKQRYRALLEWKGLDLETATYRHLIEFLLKHASLSAIEPSLTLISPGDAVYETRNILREAYKTLESPVLCRGAPELIQFDQQLGITDNRVMKEIDFSYHLETIDRYSSDIMCTSIKSFLNVVSQRKKKKRIFLIKGPPGSGKTTLIRRACAFWARGFCLRKFNLAFWVDLRFHPKLTSMAQEPSLVDFLQCLVPDGIDPSVIQEWTDKHDGEDVLLVLDGLNSHLYEKWRPILNRIFDGRWLYKSTIIVTGVIHLGIRRSRFVQYELLGLSWHQVSKQVVVHTGSNHSRAEDFLVYLSENPHMHVLSFNPLYLTALLFLFDRVPLSDLPATWTEFFALLTPTDQTLLEEIMKVALMQTECEAGSLHKLVEGFVLREVTLPYQSLVHYPQLFRFTLPLLQHYLCACHICSLPITEQIDTIQKNSHTPHILKLYSGMCSENQITAVRQYCSQNGLELAHSVCESAHKIAGPQISKLTIEQDHLSVYDVQCVFHAAWHSETPCEVEFVSHLGTNVSQEIGKLAAVSSVFAVPGAGPKVTVTMRRNDSNLEDVVENVILHACVETVKVTEQFSTLLSISCGFNELSLKSRKEEKALLSGIAKGLCTNRSIKTLVLWLYGSDVTDLGVGKLADALAVNTSLRMLSLWGNTTCTDLGVGKLADALAVNTSLRELKLWLRSRYISKEMEQRLRDAAKMKGIDLHLYII